MRQVKTEWLSKLSLYEHFWRILLSKEVPWCVDPRDSFFFFFLQSFLDSIVNHWEHFFFYRCCGHSCNSNSKEKEVGGLLRVQGQAWAIQPDPVSENKPLGGRERTLITDHSHFQTLTPFGSPMPTGPTWFKNNNNNSNNNNNNFLL
jgi:hypothetical protein